MQIIPPRASWLVLTILAIVATTARAHILPHEQGILRVLDSSVCLDATLPLLAATAGALATSSDSTDLPAPLPTILAHLHERVAVLDRGRPGSISYETVRMSGLSSVRLTRCESWLWEVRDLSVRAEIFEDAPRATLALQATRDRQIEAIVFTSQQPLHRPFRGPWRLLADFVVVGVLHILTGFDHLLFLLTILVAGTGWRHWAKVVTSFTIAHSITLVLSTLGGFRIPSNIVEPAIAASIVLVALDNFRRPGPRRHQVVLVFACGLLHGMGFASAITDFGLSGAGLLASLAGFNLGVEAGQALFLLAILSLAALLAKSSHPATEPILVRRTISLLAAVIGTGLFLQRIFLP